MLASVFLLSVPSPSFPAELLPYSPPSDTQQRPAVKPHGSTSALTQEQLAHIKKLSAQAKDLSEQERKRLKDLLKTNLESAAKAKKWSQVEYFGEALHQLE